MIPRSRRYVLSIGAGHTRENVGRICWPFFLNVGFGEQMRCDGRNNHLSRPPVPLGVWRFSIRCASGAADRRPSSGKAAVEGCLHSMRHIRNAAAQRICGSYLQTCNGVPMWSALPKWPPLFPKLTILLVQTKRYVNFYSKFAREIPRRFTPY